MSFTVQCTPHPGMIAAPNASGISVLSCVDPPLFFDGASIGRDLPRLMARFANQASRQAQDLVAIAMAVTAADTFALRESAADGWCRVFQVIVAVQDVATCSSIRSRLQEVLHFLSGDMWSFEFVPSGSWQLPKVRHRIPLGQLDCVSLFSGGLDSAIGALDLLAQKARPLLVSHAYTKDASKQEQILDHLLCGYHPVSFHADPRCSSITHDVSMRTRSFNFLAVGAAAADALASVRNKPHVDLVVPENGFIALNAPLTRRRLGSHSTRTTHPHFLAEFQSVIDCLGIRARIVNPYRTLTKGEMIVRCEDQPRLASLASATVSCGKWKRRNRQCGRCVPCIIRRAAFHAASLADNTGYEYSDLMKVMKQTSERDDVLAACLGAQRSREDMEAWANQSGPLPAAETEYREWIDIAWRGISEVASFLKTQGLLA